jgi:hypothetical protein
MGNGGKSDQQTYRKGRLWLEGEVHAELIQVNH